MSHDVSGTSSASPRWSFRHIRRVKGISTNLLEEYSKGEPSNPQEQPLSPDLRSGGSQGKLQRLWLRSPWEDYTLVRPASTEPSLASRQGMYFHRATVREFPNSGGVQLLQALSGIDHPNIAKVYDVYCYGNKIVTASEYLELSLTNIDFQSFPFEEWEVATVIVEVLRGSAYLLFKGVSCKELRMSDIRISTDGSIKIVLDLDQYMRKASDESSRLAHALIDLPYMAEIVEEMLLLRYPLDDDNVWSKDALDFVSCCLSGSIESLMKHPFLAYAKPASKLAPRVRFAVEASRVAPLNMDNESVLEE